MSDKTEGTGEEYPPFTYQDAKKLSVAELREEMQKRGINSVGTKKKMLHRLRYYAGRSPKKGSPQKSQISGTKRKLESLDDENDNDDEEVQDAVITVPPIKKMRLNDSTSIEVKHQNKPQQQEPEDSDSKSVPETEQKHDNKSVEIEKETEAEAQQEAEPAPEPQPQPEQEPAQEAEAIPEPIIEDENPESEVKSTMVQEPEAEPIIEDEKPEKEIQTEPENPVDIVADIDGDGDIDMNEVDKTEEEQDEVTQSPDLTLLPLRIQSDVSHAINGGMNDNYKSPFKPFDLEQIEKEKEKQAQRETEQPREPAVSVFKPRELSDKEEMDVDIDQIPLENGTEIKRNADPQPALAEVIADDLI